MKKLSIVLMLFLLMACSNEVIRNDASIDFTERQHDFRTIAFKKEISCSFDFINPGKTPLLIAEVKTSCGCTVPDWPHKPILPGDKGSVQINYDAAFPGVFHKTISVFYNGPGSPIELEIKGEVEYPGEK